MRFQGTPYTRRVNHPYVDIDLLNRQRGNVEIGSSTDYYAIVDIFGVVGKLSTKLAVVDTGMLPQRLIGLYIDFIPYQHDEYHMCIPNVFRNLNAYEERKFLELRTESYSNVQYSVQCYQYSNVNYEFFKDSRSCFFDKGYTLKASIELEEFSKFARAFSPFNRNDEELAFSLVRSFKREIENIPIMIKNYLITRLNKIIELGVLSAEKFEKDMLLNKRKLVQNQLNEYYKGINWGAMFQGLNPDANTYYASEYQEVMNNLIDIHDLDIDTNTDTDHDYTYNYEWKQILPNHNSRRIGSDFDIALHHIADNGHRDAIAKANSKNYELGKEKAIMLMRDVCGEGRARSFEHQGFLAIEKNGYHFVLKPNSWIKCTDPNGKKADLCIHTANFSCHPYDEVIIAYLNINNRFTEFMNMAIPHHADVGFIKNRRN